VSEFYQRRRIAIKDATALSTFFLGYVFAAAFAWPLLRAELNRGDMVRGLGYLLLAVLLTGLAAGAVGLEVGSALGAGWERYHRFRRAGGSRSASRDHPHDDPRDDPDADNHRRQSRRVESPLR